MNPYDGTATNLSARIRVLGEHRAPARVFGIPRGVRDSLLRENGKDAADGVLLGGGVRSLHALSA